MEWSWRTVLILLGLMLVAGVIIDGFRRMRKARADALRFDLSKEDLSDELYINPELPEPYRVVKKGESTKTETESYFSGFNDSEYAESEFNSSDLNSSELISSELEDSEVDSAEPKIKDESLLEPTYNEDPVAEFELEIEAETNAEIETQADEEALEQEPTPEPTPARLATRPVNLDEDFPVLLDVEELGKDEEQPQHSSVQPVEPEVDFHEKDAAPFAELAMNEVEVPADVTSETTTPETTTKVTAGKTPETTLKVTPSASEEIYTEEALTADTATENQAQAAVSEDKQNADNDSVDQQLSEKNDDEADSQETDYEDLREIENKKPAAVAPLLYASSEAEKLSDRAEAQMALVIHCISRDELGFSGDDMVSLFNQCDVRFGEREIFHRFEQADGKGSIQFSIVHSFEPRNFSPETILEQHFRGLSFFMKLPGAKNPTAAYEAMVAIAQLLAKHFNADLFDGERSALTQQTIEHERQQIVDFEFRQKVAAKKQALS